METLRRIQVVLQDGLSYRDGYISNMDLASEVILRRLQDRVNNLRPLQKKAFDLMKMGRNVFVTGAGGTGKTNVIKLFVRINPHDKNIALTSTTGASAVLLGGTTLHSYLGLGLGTGSVSGIVQRIGRNRKLYSRWCKLDILVIDEVSMMTPELFDKVEYIARQVRNNDRPFGGIQLILSGDMCQLPCVNCDKFCFEAESWSKVVDEVVYLQEIIRQSDRVFQQCLNSIRLGVVTDEVREVIDSRIGTVLENKHGVEPTVLYPINEDVEIMNEEALDRLVESGRDVYAYEMEIYGSQTVNSSIIKGCMAVELLHLCVDAQVMLISNLDVSSKLANGSRGVVIGFDDNDLPIVKFLNGQVCKVGYHDWILEEDGHIVARVSQIPLRLAYAISIHKSQGCSLDWVVMDLSKTFTWGQAYVALSRIKSLSGLSIISIDWNLVRANPRAVEFYRNI